MFGSHVHHEVQKYCQISLQQPEWLDDIHVILAALTQGACHTAEVFS